MIVVWTEGAEADALYYFDLIYSSSWDAASRFRRRLQSETLRLGQFPHSGRAGAVTGTREITLAPWPYIVVYRIDGEVVQVLTVRHGAQQYPPFGGDDLQDG